MNHDHARDIVAGGPFPPHLHSRSAHRESPPSPHNCCFAWVKLYTGSLCFRLPLEGGNTCKCLYYRLDISKDTTPTPTNVMLITVSNMCSNVKSKYLQVKVYTFLCEYVFVSPFVFMFVCVCLFFCLFNCLFFYVFVCLSVQYTYVYIHIYIYMNSVRIHTYMYTHA